MAASGALGPFLDAMVQIRSQRLRQAEVENANKMAGYSGLASGIGSFGSSIGQGIQALGAAQQQAAGDATANQMRNTALPPRAEAVGPNAGALNAAAAQAPLAGQIGYDVIPATMQPYTGGTKGFDLMSKMGQMSGQKGMSAAEAIRLGVSLAGNDRANRAEQRAIADRDFNRQSDAATDIFNDSKSYLSSSRELLKSISESQTHEDYIRNADNLRALNSMHQGRKLNVPLAQIPTWMSPADRQVKANLEAAQSAAQGQPLTRTGPLGGIHPTEVATNLQEAQQAAQGKMTPMEDYNVVRQAPGGTAAVPLPASAAGLPDNKKFNGPDGKIWVKRGGYLYPTTMGQ